MNAGDQVRLVTPENGRLHGARGTIVVVEEWGAIVETRAAASGQFRALWSEMIPAATQAAGMSVTTGGVCRWCGSLNMRRTGTCVTCFDCGNNEGCG